MLLQLIILQIGAHLLSDFIFQTSDLSEKKSKRIFTKYHLYHILIVASLSYACSFDWNFWPAAIVISITHLGVDTLKSFLQIKNHKKSYFFADQALHIAVLIAVCYAYAEWFDIDFVFDFRTIHLAIIAGFILCSKPANLIIKELFRLYTITVPKDENDNKHEAELPNAGALIGITERFLTLALILMGEYEAVGLIIAAKSILRFQEMRKNEYILIGTLLSFSIAVFTGIAIKFIT
jgi:hypothetical protein